MTLVITLLGLDGSEFLELDATPLDASEMTAKLADKLCINVQLQASVMALFSANKAENNDKEIREKLNHSLQSIEQ